MSRFAVAPIIIAVAVALPAGAQSKRSKWSAEPAKVMGVALGEPLSSALIPNCGGTDLPPEGRLPFCSPNPSGRGDVTLLEGLPLVEFDRGTVARDASDVVYAMDLQGPRDTYAAARAVLIERYGPPTTRAMLEQQNGLGAKFSGERLTWVGAKVVLTLDERYETVDRFNARFLHIKAGRGRAQAGASKTKESASKL